MKNVNEKVVNCPYCIDDNGNLLNSKVSSDVVERLYEIKKMALELESKSIALDSLIYGLEINLVRFPNDDWLRKNREKLREEVSSMPALEVLDTDTCETKKQKLIITAKIIELIVA